MTDRGGQGSCPGDHVQVPLASLGGADSAGQMKHFVDDDGMNTFRLCKCRVHESSPSLQPWFANALATKQ